MEPEFPRGCIIISEPGGHLEHGCYVIGVANNEPVFRQLVIDGDEWRLRALKAGIREVLIGGPGDIRGRVIQRAGTRRKDRKIYT